ncbi:TonB-linked outer membrane protein, SusC/RagA family [Chitinophaga eiseniae]|uniref:TonB-linked outer membrane protein, SusC/RagA family n=1 Tax=Chitinophaga eiseniae TaxID=634771 RepID=A0A1T4R5N7_9BACT|nr:SusC/RagA family TonB-linked outer membrane protein [Chitinophaga eiseniae]SKA11223.1 TonB-linked outer membrane protein, SusC/RagA family [Chitinophaga eiseniae]
MKRGLLLWLLMAIGVLHVSAQTRTITGTVRDGKGNSPIPGVSVAVKGKGTGTSTGPTGTYKLQVAPGTTLVFSFIGYTSQEVVVADQSVVDIALEEDKKQLNEVVVTALGITREKKSLGYNVQTVKGEDIVRAGENNIIESLSSKAAGVQVIGSGGTPGASSKILIRGNSTFTGNNQPLIVIDGVPIDNSTNSTVSQTYPYNANLQGVNNSNRALDINPDDIASVTILKGPSAAALYGARAGNGAIIYTTKRGKAGSVHVTYDFNAGFDKVSQLPKEQDIYAQGSIKNGVPVYLPNFLDNTNPVVESWGPKISSLSGVKVHNNTKNFFQTGTNYTHNVSATGGNEVSTYRISLSRADQKGIVPNTNFYRTSVRANFDTKVTQRLSMNASMSYAATEGTKAQNGSNTSGIMLPLLRTPASFDLKDYLNADGSSRNFVNNYDNPYWTAENNPFRDKVDRFVGNIGANYEINNWLKATYKLGADVYTDGRKQIYAIGSNGNPSGMLEENTIRSRQYYSDLILSGHKEFNEKYSVTANIGGNVTQTNLQSLYGRGTDLSIPNYNNLGNASTLYSDESTTFQRSSAFFYDVQFGYKNIVFVGTTGRNEWASTFGKVKNNFFYPSVNASFIFTDVLPKNNILTYGKLRGAIARGGLPPSPYSSLTYYVKPFFADGFTDGNSFPFQKQNGFLLNNIFGNPNLKAQTAVEKEIGLDLRFFDARLNIEATYYNKKTSDLLVLRPLAGSSGFQKMLDNTGSMVNKGWEIAVSGDVVRSKDFNWNVNINFTRNKNEVLELGEGVSEIDVEPAFTAIGSFAIVGQPYGALYASKWKRTDKGELIIGANGLPLVEAKNGNIGNPFPDWTAGARSTFNYKGITLGVLFDIREGGKIWNGTIARMHQLGRSEESADRERTYVIPGVTDDGTGKLVPNTQAITAEKYFKSYLGDGAGSATENAVYDGSWVRLREVSLSYRWNFKNQKIIRFVELIGTGRNLWLSTKYPGVDPETSLTGAGSNLTGFDYFNNPGTKTYAIGVKLGL